MFDSRKIVSRDVSNSPNFRDDFDFPAASRRSDRRTDHRHRRRLTISVLGCDDGVCWERRCFSGANSNFDNGVPSRSTPPLVYIQPSCTSVSDPPLPPQQYTPTKIYVGMSVNVQHVGIGDRAPTETYVGKFCRLVGTRGIGTYVRVGGYIRTRRLSTPNVGV